MYGDSCGTCQFFVSPTDGRRLGSCHAKPPTVIGARPTTCWPEVGTEEWCGEFTRR